MDSKVLGDFLMKVQSVQLKIDNGQIQSQENFAKEMRMILINMLQKYISSAKIYPIISNLQKIFEERL